MKRFLGTSSVCALVACSATIGGDPNGPTSNPPAWKSASSLSAAATPLPSVGFIPPPTGGEKTGSLSRSSTQNVMATPLANPVVYNWAQNQQPVSTVMMPLGQGWCFLTGVTGHFAGKGEAVYISESNGFWVLAGQSGQQDVAATATCVPWSTINPTWSNVGYSWDAYAYVSTSSFDWVDITLWGSSAFCSLMGVGGAFAGSFESAETYLVGANWVQGRYWPEQRHRGVGRLLCLRQRDPDTGAR